MSGTLAARIPSLLVAVLSILALSSPTQAVASARSSSARDRDHDRLPDRWERRHGLSVRHRSAGGDPDRDRLSNRSEYRRRLDPRRWDTDRDGLNDGYEVRRSKTDPRHFDTDGDGLGDGLERKIRSNPRDPHSPGLPTGSPVFPPSTGMAPTTPAPAPAGAPTPPYQGLVVDRDSVGGRCDDGQPASAVSTAAPWCSLERAARAAPAGATVYVRQGTYPSLVIEENENRDDYLTFKPFPSEEGLVSVSGASFWDSQYFRLEGLRITGGVTMDGCCNPEDASSHIQIVANDISPYGVRLRTHASDILIEQNSIHDIARSPGAADPDGTAIWLSGGGEHHNLAIRGNHITDVPIDGIQLSRAYNVLIESNEIANVRRPPGFEEDHPDSIQVLGCVGVTLRSNYVHDSESGYQIEGGTRDLVVVNNLIVRMAGYGVNVGDAPGSSWLNNTVWDNGFGGVNMGDDPSHTPILDMVLANNILQSLQGAQPQWFAYEDYNVIPRDVWFGAHDVRTAPRFVDGYNLAAGSPGVDAGTSAGIPARDRLARERYDDLSTPNSGDGPFSFYDMGANERR